MLGIQILSVTFIVCMLYVVRIHYKKNELSKIESTIWSAMLVNLGIIILNKRYADFVRSLFNVDRLTDIIVIVALMLVFVVMIENRIQISSLRRKLTKLVMDSAQKS